MSNFGQSAVFSVEMYSAGSLGKRKMRCRAMNRQTILSERLDINLACHLIANDKRTAVFRQYHMARFLRLDRLLQYLCEQTVRTYSEVNQRFTVFGDRQIAEQWLLPTKPSGSVEMRWSSFFSGIA